MNKVEAQGKRNHENKSKERKKKFEREGREKSQYKRVKAKRFLDYRNE